MVEGSYATSIAVNVCAVGCGVVIGFALRNWVRSSPRIASTIINNSKMAEEMSFSDIVEGDHKLVLVVQNGLKMGKGKIAAQCAHASVIAYQLSTYKNPPALKQWMKSGQRKVVVKVEDEESLLKLAEKAKKSGLITSLVCDAGRTQVAAGSRTVLGIGPGPEKFIDSITGHLKLL